MVGKNGGGKGGRPGIYPVQGQRERGEFQAFPAEDSSRTQALAHPSFFRLPIVGRLLERASAKASPHFLLLKLPQEEARWQSLSAGQGLEAITPTPYSARWN